MKSAMSKLFVTSLVFFVGTPLFSQNVVEANISNLTPRVGEEVQISVNLHMLSDTLIKQSDGVYGFEVEYRAAFEGEDYNPKWFFSTQNFSIETPGKKVIGPLTFTINGVAYETNPIEIYVLEELPRTPGYWVRKVENKDDDTFIIEQIWEEGLDDEDFLSIDVDHSRFENFDIERWSVSLKNIDENVDKSKYPNGLTVLMSEYKVSKRNAEAGEFVLTEKDLVNLPEEFKDQSVSIKLETKSSSVIWIDNH
ncbi:MAG: hypothetical protein SchgKO_23170 [Schleiferiaceae bacterium]